MQPMAVKAIVDEEFANQLTGFELLSRLAVRENNQKRQSSRAANESPKEQKRAREREHTDTQAHIHTHTGLHSCCVFAFTRCSCGLLITSFFSHPPSSLCGQQPIQRVKRVEMLIKTMCVEILKTDFEVRIVRALASFCKTWCFVTSASLFALCPPQTRTRTHGVGWLLIHPRIRHTAAQENGHCGRVP